MRKEEIQEAYSKLHASEELVKEVLMLEEKKTLLSQMHLRRGRMLCGMICALLIAACAVVLSLSSLGIPSYAEVAGDKELDVTFFVPEYEQPPRETQPWEKHLSSSLFAENSDSDENDKPVIEITWLKEDFPDYDRVFVFVNGRLMKVDLKNLTRFTIHYTDGRKGEGVWITVEDKLRIDILLHDEDTVSTVMHLAMEVEKVEGGYNVTMAEDDLALLESGCLIMTGY